MDIYDATKTRKKKGEKAPYIPIAKARGFTALCGKNFPLRSGKWYIEISGDGKRARAYLNKERFCFIEHFHQLTENVPEFELEQPNLAGPLGRAGPQGRIAAAINAAA